MSAGGWMRLGRALAAFSIASGLASIPVQVFFGNLPFEHRPDLATAPIAFAVSAVGFGAIVWVALPSQLENRLVWVLLWASFCSGIAAVGTMAISVSFPAALTTEAAVSAVSPAQLPAVGAVGAMLVNVAFVPALFLVAAVGLVLFPDGRVVVPRWAWLAQVNTVLIVLTSVFAGLAATPTSTAPLGRNFISFFEFGAVDLITGLLFVPLIVGVVLAVVAVAQAYRQSVGVTQTQIKWIAFGGVSALVGGAFRGFDIVGPAVAGMVVFIATFYVAITKHRLYDIDIVVSKTVAFALLVGIIGSLYVGVVYGFGSLVSAGDQISFDVQVIATVAVAIAFQPVGRRAQAWANRFVYGQRATPYEVLAKFSHGAAEASDDELLEKIPRLIVEGTAATEATVWLEAGDEFRAAGSSDRDRGNIIPAVAGFADPESDFSVPIYHDGELLGGLSLETSRGEDLLPPEQELIEQLAAGLGLALRNARLTSQLRNQVAELEASRERILAAADDARRDLERDLDSGPQQQLVALKVMLGPTRIKAEQAGATKTATMVAQLEAEAGEAIKAVRDFSSGVYPPLLEAEGIVVAIRQRVGKTSLPIAIEDRGLRRYPREIEAAAYFAILEALQNIAKYADASEVDVAIGETAGELSFTVTDNGVGFDPSQQQTGSGLANMSDRLDAVGGRLSIESTPGEGTVVSGSVPVAVSAPV